MRSADERGHSHTDRAAHAPEARLTPLDRRKSLIAIIACISVCGIGYGLTLPLIGLSMERMGASGGLIGLNTAMMAIATIGFTPLVPRILRAVGVMRLMLACIAATILLILAFKAIPNIWLWFPLRFLLGCALAGLFVVTEFWINEISGDRSRGRIMGLYAAVLSGGFALGPITLQFTGTLGWAPFVTGVLIIAVASLPLALVRGVAPDLGGRQHKSVLGFIAIAPAAICAAFVFGAVEMGVFNMLPVYGVRNGLDERTAALMLAAISAGNVLLQYPIGWIADRVDRQLVLALCALVGLIGAATLPVVVGIPVLRYPSLFVWGGVIVGLYTVGLVLLGQRFSGPDLAAANAAFVMLYGVGALVGPPLVGTAMDIWEPHGFAAVFAFFCAAYLVLALYRWIRVSAPVPEAPRRSDA